MKSGKQKPFRASKEVKRRARRQIGTPPPSKQHVSLKLKRPKHKKLDLEISEEGG